jgi:hypothetical protein
LPGIGIPPSFGTCSSSRRRLPVLANLATADPLAEKL